MSRFGAFFLVAMLIAACGGGSSTAGSTSSSICPNGGTVRMGVEPFDDTSLLLPIYQQIADQIQQRLGCTIKLDITASSTAEVEAMRAKHLDVGEFSPLGYVFAHSLANAEPVATFADKTGTPMTYYANIVTWRGSGITSLDQVKGKKFAYSDPASTSGHLYPAYALKKAGIDPENGVQVMYAGGPTASFLAIKDHRVDAGELNSNQYTSADFPTLWKSDPIPQDPITVRGDLSQAFKDRFKAALLAVDLSLIADPKGELIGPKLVAQTDAPYTQIRDLTQVLGLDVNHL